MPFQVTCPQCGSVDVMPDVMAGKPLKCADCGCRLLIADTPFEDGRATAARPSKKSPPLVEPFNVKFTCPNCKTVCHHSTPGAKVFCHTCGQRILVPGPPPPQNKTVVAPWQQELNRPPAPAGPPQAELDDDALVFVRCPECGCRVTVPESSLEQWVRCRGCQETFRPDSFTRQPAKPGRPLSSRLSPSKSRQSTLGWVLLVLGVIVLLSALAMDTTVPVPGTGGRVHNVGLMQQQTMGVLAGVGCAVIGASLLARGGTSQCHSPSAFRCRGDSPMVFRPWGSVDWPRSLKRLGILVCVIALLAMCAGVVSLDAPLGQRIVVLLFLLGVLFVGLALAVGGYVSEKRR